MLGLRVPGGGADVAPSRLISEVTNFSKAEHQRSERVSAATRLSAAPAPGGRGGALRLRAAIRDGACVGPRLLCAGQPVTTPRGHCHQWGQGACSASDTRGLKQLQELKRLEKEAAKLAREQTAETVKRAKQIELEAKKQKGKAAGHFQPPPFPGALT